MSGRSPVANDDDSVSDLFAFSLPVLDRDAPREPLHAPWNDRPTTSFGQAAPRAADLRGGSADEADNPFAFGLDSVETTSAPPSPERPKTARPESSYGRGEAASSFGISAGRPLTASGQRTSSGQDSPQGYQSGHPQSPAGGFFATRPEVVAEEDEDDDDDCGMFSFHRPATGEEPPPNSMIPLEEVLRGPGFDFMKTATSPQPTTAASSFPQATSPPSTGDLLVSAHGDEQRRAERRRARDAVPPMSASTDRSAVGDHRSIPQGVWHLPGDPDRVTSDPFDSRLVGSAGGREIFVNMQDLDGKGALAADQAISSAVHLDRRTSSNDVKYFDIEDAAPTRGLRRRRPQPREDSAYPEVQASVSNIDDPIACVLTLRVWFLGLLFCLVIASLNMFFSLRYPAPLVTPIITQLFSYPLGKFLARYVPSYSCTPPKWSTRIGMPEKISLNPGPFSIKEHALLVIMANVATSPAFALNYSLVAEKFYGQHQPAAFDFLLVLTTQLIGFGVAGLCRRLLVWPASMLWPQNLVYCTLLNTFHAEIEDEETGPTRLRFFAYIFAGAFCWFWLPGFLFAALSAFSWVCWIAPNNIVVNQLFGVSSGLGMGLFTFDWSQIAYVASPLVVPWWAQVNIFGGFCIAFWIIAPIMYYTNAFNSAYLPMSTSSVFDRFGQEYNVTQVLDVGRLKLDKAAYAAYSPVYMPVTYLINYGATFMLSIGILVHTAIFSGPDIYKRILRRPVKGDVDVHMKLMARYPDVPDWAYLAFLLLAFALSAVTVACWPTGMPVWALLIAILVAIVYVVPAGYVYALTSYNVSINLIAEFIGGYLIPEQPLANMLFKIYASNLLNYGLYFAQDLKFGHYMKIPPRETFKVQVVAVVATACAQVGVKRWLMSVVPTLCEADQSAHLSCPSARTFFSTSIIWGLIGPARLFNYEAYYHPLLFWMIGGVVIPALTWVIVRRWPNCWLQYFHLPIALTGIGFVPPASGINFSSALIVGFIFQYLVRRKNFDWWSKYNFVLSAAMDSGTIVCGILIFLSVQLPRDGTIAVNWWGNEVFTNTLDWAGASFKTAPEQGFGPTVWI
ncbi:hypothetical protein JCM10908_003554 [Rhodotorula pacifica]|uniref:uncharacterized protein n=1 Tax=Rhodotorula pacifica TaxID=1495444 RepID=UPI0031719183